MHRKSAHQLQVVEGSQDEVENADDRRPQDHHWSSRGHDASDRFRQWCAKARLITDDADTSLVDGIDWLRETVVRLGVRRLSEYGLRPTDADTTVSRAATAGSTQGNPVALTPDELHGALASAL